LGLINFDITCESLWMPSLEGGDDLGSYECGLTIPSMVIYKC
jgi:hypothetical protein